MSVEEALKTLTNAGWNVELSKPQPKVIRYNIKEVAEKMGYRSIQTVYSLINPIHGKAPRMKCERVGGTVYIHQSHIDEYLNRKGKISKTKSDYEAEAETKIICGEVR